jgi:hypothetical protein
VTIEIALDATSAFDFILHSANITRPQILSEEKGSGENLSNETKELPSAPPPPVASPPIPRLSTSWNCQLCTFANVSSAPRCDMCGTENPTRGQNGDDEGENVIEAQENNSSTPADYAVWMCAQCTFMNQMDNMR